MKRSLCWSSPPVNALLFLLLSLPWLSCSGRKTAFTYLPPKTESRNNAAELKKLAEEAWQRRGKTAAAEEALQKYKAAYQANPSDTAVAIRLSEAHFFVAEYVMVVKGVKSKEREKCYEQGLSAGERALELHAGFRAVNRETRDEEKALAQLDGTWRAAVFWTYANMARWEDRQNPFRKVGNEQRLEIYRKRVHQLDDEFYYGGVYRISGIIDKGNTVDEVRYESAYEKALAIAPDFFSNHRVFAVKYARPKKQFDLYNEHLNRIASGDPKGVPENMYEQEIAAALLKEEQQKQEAKEEKPKREFKPRY